MELPAFLLELVDYERILANQFFVLYPYGFGWSTPDTQALAYNLEKPPPLSNASLRPLLRSDRTLRGWNSGVAGVTTGPGIDDVGFIQHMIEVVNQRLRAELRQSVDVINELTDFTFPWELVSSEKFTFEVRAPEQLFDVNRRYLFGYSNGGMLAHRLVREMPDHWAAVWGMSTTVGGKPNHGFGNPEDATVNLPQGGRRSISFFAHHGEKDEIAPPGNTVMGVMNVFDTPDFSLQVPTTVAPVYLQYQLAGFGSPAERERYLPGFLPLAQGWRGYVEYNDLLATEERRPRPGLLRVPAEGSAYSYSSGDVGPEFGDYPFARNPIAVMYIDPEMGHANFTSHPNRYFFASDVWEFFRRHPQVLL